jgi:hypothetical protein
MRVIKVLAAGALALLLSGFGSGQGLAREAFPYAQESREAVFPNTPAKQAEGLTLIALSLRQESNPNRPGWNSVTVELGIRNDTSTPQYVDTVGGSTGVFKVAEGDATYDTEITGSRYSDWILLPPGFAICGQLAESRSEVIRPTAVTDVPSSLHPVELSLDGFPTIDLTKKPSSAACTPTPQGNAPTAPTSVKFTAPGGSVDGVMEISGYQPFPGASFGGQTRVNSRVTNSDKFEDLDLTDLHPWLVDKDGVVRFADELPGDSWVGENCEFNIPGTLTVPPASTENARACYPYRPNGSPFAVIVQYESSNPSVVRLPTSKP